MSTPTLPRPEIGASRIRPTSQPAIEAEVDLEPAIRPVRFRWLVGIGLTLIVGVFAGRCLDVARTDSITSDESTHLIHCLNYWLTGDDLAMWELGAPRLPHLANARASFEALGSAGLLPPADAADRLPRIRQLVLSGIPRALVPARCVAIGSGVALLLVAFWAVARTRGAAAGLVAAGLLAMVPEVIAHASIAGSDLPFTASAFLALVLMARYAERPGPGRWAALALAIGLAWAMRHTALLLLALAGGVHLWCAWRMARPRGWAAVQECLCGSALASVSLGVVAALVLWAGDGFGTITMAEAGESITSVDVPSRIGPVDVSALPVPTSLLSILKQVSHQSKGHEAYFLGEYRQQGWATYFPVAFLLKTPVGFLALMVLATARVRPKGAWEAIALAFLALLWVTLIRNKVNIGVRYALLTYPLVLPFVARLFEPSALRDRVWGPIVLVAALGFAGESAACHPRYLSSFNAIGGGPAQGWLYLADSNVDWGQDFDALAATLKRLGIHDVTIDVSTERKLVEPGLCALVNPSREFQVPAETPPLRRLIDLDGGYLPVYTRYVAVSVSRLLGLYSGNDMSWLRTRRLVARVGNSIFLFDMDQPADVWLGSNEVAHGTELRGGSGVGLNPPAGTLQ